MLRILNVRVKVPMEGSLEALAAKKLRCSRKDIVDVCIAHRSVDARRKPNIYFVYTLDVHVKQEKLILAHCKKDADIRPMVMQRQIPVVPGNKLLPYRPVVVGTGPAGLFAAFILAKYGYRPIVLERGYDIDTRTRHVQEFWQGGLFRPDSNVQFGEGGAGTFSDGKLTTRVNHPLISVVLQCFVEAGAPKEIMYAYNPHVGTDVLRNVVGSLRHTIEDMGGSVYFNHCVTGIRRDENGVVRYVVVNDTNEIRTDVVVMGIGHSARDTYRMLYDAGIVMENKPFAMGVRIEHPQDMIDRSQYGCPASQLGLEAAEYALVYHSPDGRAAYSFCMCPGGLVVAAASEEGMVVTNGMSMYHRDSGIANSALVVNVATEDIGGTDPMDAIAFQRRYERLAYEAGGCNYRAPAQTVGDFLHRAGPKAEPLTYSYRPGVVWSDLHRVLPEFVSVTLEQALPYFGRRIHGFDNNGVVMTGVETRTSAPVRILRGEDGMAVRTAGLYPVGEGAGYAGGIMSASIDGMNTAIKIINTYKPLEAI